jgi:hypothetical protein
MQESKEDDEDKPKRRNSLHRNVVKKKNYSSDSSEGEASEGQGKCQVCRRRRWVSRKVMLYGLAYDTDDYEQFQWLSAASSSMEEEEETMTPPTSQSMLYTSGRCCADRVYLYHQLKHYRYGLAQRCQTRIEREYEHLLAHHVPPDQIHKTILENLDAKNNDPKTKAWHAHEYRLFTQLITMVTEFVRVVHEKNMDEV